MPVSVGERVAVGKEGHRATVRYVGPVRGQEGQWAGLEWDEPSRGKHNGTVDGTTYFECRSSSVAETPASLVRLDKLRRGTTFAAALRARYQAYRDGGESKEGGEEEEAMVVMTASERTVAVEFVGAEQLSVSTALPRLKVASLRNNFVSAAGEADELAGLAPQLEELDLSGNLLSSWAEVEAVVGALPKLTALNLTANRMSSPQGALPTALRLRVLVLNQTGIQWEQMTALGRSLPSLAQLYLNANAISVLRDSGEPPIQLQGIFPSLTLLSLEENKLSEWSQVAALACLPRLEQLHLSGNAITNVDPPLEGEWAALRQVTLGQNAISSWGSVDALGGFPSLRELRLSGNPLLGGARSGGRFEVIARVAALRLLNGSAIQPRERQDAEIRYLRIVWGELEEAKDIGRSAVEAANPRLEELLGKYGPMSSSTAAADCLESLATQMKEVKLTCTSLRAGGVMGTKVKKLPGSMTVAQLKKLCETLFKLKASEQALWLKISGEPMPENIGGDESRALSYFDLKDGYEIIIDDPK